MKAGKSTLLNAIVGENLAPTDAGECTRIVTWYRYSDRPYATIFPVDGDPVETSYVRGEGSLEVDLGDRDAEAIDHLEIGWPSSRLADVVLIDTPGIASISTEVSARTHRALSAEMGRVPVADAVLYLLRHTHSADLRFLESFHDDEVAEGTPVNTVGVLSRADEIGSARLDAMEVADRVARRYQVDSRLHRLCPIVVPVNGLLGHAAATLREDEYAALAAVARAPREMAGELLLTADRFAIGDSSLVPVDERARLLDRLGLFGVRLSVELVRTGAVATSSELAARLADVSGLERLREVVLRQFGARARVLKARSAVAGAARDLPAGRLRRRPGPAAPPGADHGRSPRVRGGPDPARAARRRDLADARAGGRARPAHGRIRPRRRRRASGSRTRRPTSRSGRPRSRRWAGGRRSSGTRCPAAPPRSQRGPRPAPSRACSPS